MNESLLHYLWRFQKFSKSDLQTVDGQSLEILFPGHLNTLAGPDFSQAKIYLDQLYWGGAVELHMNASDWFRHGHQNDSAYDNVILHVVWNFDSDVCYPNGTPIPTLELSNYVAAETLDNYSSCFLKKPQFISCEKELGRFSSAKWLGFQERLFVERMEFRTQVINEQLEKSKNDWEAVFFVLLSKGFGLNLNGEAFYAMAASIPFKRLLQLRSDPLDLEALFMGQAGLLAHPLKGSYHNELFQRYSYIKSKYKLSINPAMRLHFARLRPPNFPTIRLAQLAQVYAKSAALFQAVVQESSLSNCYKLFDVEASGYWERHYNFEVESKPNPKRLSRRFFELLLINTLIPVRFAYAKYCGSLSEDSLFEWAAAVPAESNRILRKFRALEVPQINAVGTQSLLHLYKNYCKFKKCLSCQVGHELMKTV